MRGGGLCPQEPHPPRPSAARLAPRTRWLVCRGEAPEQPVPRPWTSLQERRNLWEEALGEGFPCTEQLSPPARPVPGRAQTWGRQEWTPRQKPRLCEIARHHSRQGDGRPEE